MRKSITVIPALLLFVSFLFLGCQNITHVCNTTTNTNTNLSNNDEYIEIEVEPAIYKTTEQLINSIRTSQKSIATQAIADSNNLCGIDSFYVPSATFSGFELYFIEVLETRIGYYYIPVGTEDLGFNYETGIEVCYARNQNMTVDNSLTAIAHQLGRELTAEGLVYDKGNNQIYFSVGNSWMYLMVPDSMNDYDLLKKLCIANRVDVN